MIGLDPIDSTRLAVSIVIFAAIIASLVSLRGLIPSGRRRPPPPPPRDIAAIARRQARPAPAPANSPYAPQRTRLEASRAQINRLHDLALLARTLPYGEMMRLSEQLCREMGAGNPGLTPDHVAAALHRWANA